MLLTVPRNGFQNHPQGLVREASPHSSSATKTVARLGQTATTSHTDGHRQRKRKGQVAEAEASQDDESTKSLLKALAYLTLRVEQQVRQQMTQTCMVIAMQTDKDGLLPHLVDLANQWKN